MRQWNFGGCMRIVVMFVWMFIIQAIPFKKILASTVFAMVLVGAMMVVNDYNAVIKERGGVIFAKDNK